MKTAHQVPLLKSPTEAASSVGAAVILEGAYNTRRWIPYRDGLRYWRVRGYFRGEVAGVVFFKRRKDAELWLAQPEFSRFLPFVIVRGVDAEDAAERFKKGEVEANG